MLKVDFLRSYSYAMLQFGAWHNDQNVFTVYNIAFVDRNNEKSHQTCVFTPFLVLSLGKTC